MPFWIILFIAFMLFVSIFITLSVKVIRSIISSVKGIGTIGSRMKNKLLEKLDRSSDEDSAPYVAPQEQITPTPTKEPRYCKSCGARLPEDSHRCEYCGK